MSLAVVTLAGIGKVITFLFMLSVLVVLHELGHFVIARRLGVRVNEFAIGMGPKLLGWTSPRTGTLYSLRALPIGGYCAMQGEDGKTSEAEQQREFRSAQRVENDNFQAKSPWQRLAIVLAGPIANFVLCYVMLLVRRWRSESPAPVTSPSSEWSSRARRRRLPGCKPGDRIVAIDGAVIAQRREAGGHDPRVARQKARLVYQRNGMRTEVYVTPTACPVPPGKKGSGCIGFSPVPAYQRVGDGGSGRRQRLEFRNDRRGHRRQHRFARDAVSNTRRRFPAR